MRQDTPLTLEQMKAGKRRCWWCGTISETQEKHTKHLQHCPKNARATHKLYKSINTKPRSW